MAMKIKQLDITCRELAEGFVDNAEEGVKGYGGKLDIRPPYQREFIYGDKERDAVIHTVYNGYPLNVMYWSDRGDGTFEIIDGQQRTISICQYINGIKPYNYIFFHNVKDPEERKKVLDYKLTVYVCSGPDTEKLEWFKTINIAGKELTQQELKNAVFAGTFVTDAKKYFSKTNCAAYRLGKDLVNGSPIRQDFLHTALKWICYSQGIKDIDEYMGEHQSDPNAIQLWTYFQTVINWAKNNFVVSKRKSIMKGLDWSKLYEANKEKILDKEELDKQIALLLKDSEVENKKGIIPYVLSGDERLLGLRTFGQDIIEAKYAEQEGICPICKQHFELSEMEADHIKPWSKGGKTVESNCQMLCIHCNRTKSGK